MCTSLVGTVQYVASVCVYVTSGHGAVCGECVCVYITSGHGAVRGECVCMSLVGTVQDVVSVHMVDIVLRLFRLFGCVMCD